MRSLLVLLTISLTITPCLAGQESSGASEAPRGTNWIADQRSNRYYPVDCDLVQTVALADRRHYATETGVMKDGYTRSPDCPDKHAPHLEDVAPVQAVPPPSIRNSQVQASVAPVTPINKHQRRGFWFNGGLGYGSLGCDDCGDREGGLSGGIELGGSVSQKVLLGVGTTGWTKDEGGATLTVGTLVALIRFYPSATGGFFLIGGLGVGSIHAEVDGFGSDTETGGGALLGLGYDIRVGENVSLTPFWNGFAARTSNADANVGQLGLSITVH
jgi:hypothetical protein